LATGDVSYLEIGSEDAKASASFFAALFAWRFSAMGEGGDGWFETGGARVGLHGNDPEHGIVPYFRVDDIEAAAARVRELGGSVEEPGADEAGFGKFRNCRDANGVRFGLHEPV